MWTKPPSGKRKIGVGVIVLSTYSNNNSLVDGKTGLPAHLRLKCNVIHIFHDVSSIEVRDLS